jgi:hypothetical protein
VKNIYKEDVNIASVRTSCGCTTASIEKQILKSGEVGTILARYNTDTHYGKKGATITVVVNKPFFAEVQLRVDGYIRRDVVFNPGELEFGQIEMGSPVTKTVKVAYAGRDSWKILSVDSRLPFVSVRPREISRGAGLVNYELDVTVSEEAPAGFHQDSLIVRTTDANMTQVPLPLTLDVSNPISISPSTVNFGELKPGESFEKRFIVKGQGAFRVTGGRCPGFEVTVTGGDRPKNVHAVQVRITPSAEAATTFNGSANLHLTTDLTGDPQLTTVLVGKIILGG